MKSIAVLMSTYNGEKYISEQIDSIILQKTNYKVDLIVRDDGSTDNTRSILNDYQSNGKLKVYSDENVGAGYSFLKMILDNPGYDFYAFADQDDFWKKEKIQQGINIIDNVDNYAVYCSNAEMCDCKLNPLGRNVHRNMKIFNDKRVFLGLACAQGCTIIINSKMAKLIQSKGISDNIVLHDSFITSLCFLLDGFFYADEKATLKYRMHGNNIGGLNTASQSKKMTMIKKRVEYIMHKSIHSIEDQNKNIVKLYGDVLDNKKITLMNYIYDSKKSLVRRFKLAFDLSIKDESFNLDIANRLKILFNNF